MTPLEIKTAALVIAKPINDLYELGKEKFSEKLSIWQNKKNYEKLTKKIGLAEKVKPLWMLDKEVSLTSFYYPSKIRFNEKEMKHVKSLKDLPTIHNFVIQGTVGQGKSIFLRFLTLQELKSSGTSRIPLFIELRHVTKEKNLNANVKEAFSKLGFEIDEELFNFYASSGKVVLLLDAFDELQSEVVNNTINEIEFLVEKFPETQVIITSRPDSDIQKSRHFRVVRLEPLSQEDFAPFLKKMTVDGTQLDSILTAIENTNNQIKNLLTTPLLLTLLVMVYKSEKRIPDELAEFYEQVFNTLFYKHDKSKAGYSRETYTKLNERSLKNMFEAFCFMTKKNSFSTSLDMDQFNLAFDQAKKYGDECNSIDFKKDITKVACILQEEGDRVNFIHKSIQEYYSASFIKKASDEAALSFYTKMMTSSWHAWSQELLFLKEIDGHRFSKYFALPNMHQLISYYSKASEDDESLISYIGKYKIIAIENEEKSGVYITGVGNLDLGKSVRNYYGESALINVLNHFFEWSKKNERVVSDFIKDKKIKIDKNIQFDLMDLLAYEKSLVGVMKMAIHNMIASFRKDIEKMNLAISNEESKKIEFDFI